MYEYSLSANSASIFAQACEPSTSRPRAGLFVRFGEENDVAIQHNLAPVQIHHHRQFRRQQLLVVLRARP
jgi:hypothetical protein